MATFSALEIFLSIIIKKIVYISLLPGLAIKYKNKTKTICINTHFFELQRNRIANLKMQICVNKSLWP